MPDEVKDYLKKMNQNDYYSYKLQNETDKGNAQLQKLLYTDMKNLRNDLDKRNNNPTIKTVNPEEEAAYMRQKEHDKYIELNDKYAASARDELLNNIKSPTDYPMTLGDDLTNDYKQLKKNMLNIMTDPGNIESIVNELQIEDIKKLNNIFITIQNKYIKKYGFNNPNLTNKEIKTFLLNEISKSPQLELKDLDLLRTDMMKNINDINDNIKKSSIIINDFTTQLNDLKKNNIIDNMRFIYTMQKIQDATKTINDIYYQQNEISWMMKNNNVNNDLEESYRRLEDENNSLIYKIRDIEKTKEGLLEELDIQEGEKQKYKKESRDKDVKKELIRVIDGLFTRDELSDLLAFNEDDNILKKDLLFSLNDEPLDFLQSTVDDRIKELQNFINQNSNDEKMKGIVNKYNKMLKDIEPEKKVAGTGIKKLPANMIRFGSILINKKKLMYDNILSIAHLSGAKINLYKNKKISDVLCDLLLNIINDVTNNKLVIDTLKDDENLIYNSLLRYSNLHKKYNVPIERTINELKNRFQLLEGEIISGNTNDDIMKELKGILRKMIDFKLISDGKAKKYIKEIKLIN